MDRNEILSSDCLEDTKNTPQRNRAYLQINYLIKNFICKCVDNCVISVYNSIAWRGII